MNKYTVSFKLATYFCAPPQYIFNRGAAKLERFSMIHNLMFISLKITLWYLNAVYAKYDYDITFMQAWKKQNCRNWLGRIDYRFNKRLKYRFRFCIGCLYWIEDWTKIENKEYYFSSLRMLENTYLWQCDYNFLI